MRRSDGAVLGVCGLYPTWFDDGAPDETDLGYRLGRASWGQGYGLEAATEVLRRAKENHGLDRVGSNVQTPNVANHKILMRLGFTFLETCPALADPSHRALVWVDKAGDVAAALNGPAARRTAAPL